MKRFFCAVVCVTCCVTCLFAENESGQISRLQQRLLFENEPFSEIAMTSEPPSIMEMPMNTLSFQAAKADIPGTKSKTLAILLSAAVPGAGEIYCGSYIKGIGFLAVETLCWVAYAHYDKEGNNIEDEFHAFADTHWNEDNYWNWISTESGINITDEEALRAWEQEHYSHGLHREKDQQYYEMIGKYDQFNIGWDDTETPFARDSQRRDFYETRRDASNKAFKKASTGQMIALGNHLLSALDAAWTVNKYNKRVIRTSMRITPSRYFEDTPMLTLRVTW